LAQTKSALRTTGSDNALDGHGFHQRLALFDHLSQRSAEQVACLYDALVGQ